MNTQRLSALKSELKYSLRLIFRPFDSFYCLKHEKRGSILSATIILFLTVLTYLLNRQYAGYFFTSYKPSEYNVLVEIATIIAPFTLFVITNWCLTTLMDGEGSMKDVYIATCYALTPVILLVNPLTLLGNILSQNSAAYYNFIIVLAMAWAFFLVFTGTMITHQYMLLKTLVTMLLIVMGMVIISFLFLLLYSVIQQFVFFIVSSYNELTYRM